jgi:hypothetical protein
MSPDGNLLANLPDQVFEQLLVHGKILMEWIVSIGLGQQTRILV